MRSQGADAGNGDRDGDHVVLQVELIECRQAPAYFRH